MHRISLTIDEALYEEARAFSFLEKKSISKIIRESLSEYLSKSREKKVKTQLLLEADDEKEILEIIKNDDFSSNEDFKKKFNL
jgi:metal-responsive CopG/Arc/MetJ family transcriptional regulator